MIPKSPQSHPKMTPKCFRNDPKMIPKWPQNDPQMTPKWPQSHPKVAQSHRKVIAKKAGTIFEWQISKNWPHRCSQNCQALFFVSFWRLWSFGQTDRWDPLWNVALYKTDPTGGLEIVRRWKKVHFRIFWSFGCVLAIWSFIGYILDVQVTKYILNNN